MTTIQTHTMKYHWRATSRLFRVRLKSLKTHCTQVDCVLQLARSVPKEIIIHPYLAKIQLSRIIIYIFLSLTPTLLTCTHLATVTGIWGINRTSRSNKFKLWQVENNLAFIRSLWSVYFVSLIQRVMKTTNWSLFKSERFSKFSFILIIF